MNQYRSSVAVVSLIGILCVGSAAGQDVIVIGREGSHCADDRVCINRIHYDIPMTARAEPGQTIVYRTRNAQDSNLDPAAENDDPPGFGAIHPLTGPVNIVGARQGDVLAITILDIDPGDYGFTSLVDIGFVADQVEGPLNVLWRLDRQFARSDDIPGVRIPNASFPGIVTVLPGPAGQNAMLTREAELAGQGGAVNLPYATDAVPEAVCGSAGTHEDECLRTFPPREHGGNLDIRYLGVGSTIYLPCYIDGCGLAIGDVHYAQGDGEVAGTAIEMDADVTVTTRVIRDGPRLTRGPHYEGPARLLDIPSRRFYATTGFPLKAEGEVPPDMEYLGSANVAALENLSKDISLAARNALLEMIDYMVETYELTPQQAYIVASVAVDLRIGQLVDAPNVGVTAILPLDIFSRQ